MADSNPTVVVAHLNDEEIKNAIDKLVEYVNKGATNMAVAFDEGVKLMESSLTRLSQSTKRTFDDLAKAKNVLSDGASGGDRRGGTSGRGGVNLNDDVIKEFRGQNVLKIYDEQLQKLRTRLLDVRQDIDIFRHAIGSGKATQVSWGQEGLKKANEEAERLMVIIDRLEKQRVNLSNVVNPGQQFQNFLHDLTHANEELSMLNEKFRRGESLLQQEAKAEQKMTEEIKRQNAERSKQNKKEYSDRLMAYGRMPDSDLRSAEEKLRKLLALKNDLRRDPLLSLSQMQQLNNKIQGTINKIKELRAASAPRPTMSVSSVLGMSEKSLDDIAMKMRAISSVRGTLNLQTQSNELNRLNEAYTRLGRRQSELLGQNNRLVESNNGLARSFGYIRNRIVYALTLGAATSFVKQIYDIRGQYELLERSLGVLVNSFQKGSQIFQELNQMAIKSPFTLIELAGAAKQLTAYNFSAKEVVDTTRRLADISAALGVPMERLTYNLGQIRAQTVLTARDARDFANAGLPMVKSLADYYSELEGRVVSTGDVYERMSKKMVSFTDVMAVLNRMTDEGGKFFDFQAKQANTLKVQIANLSLAWNNMLNEMGEMNQGLLTAPIKGMKTLLQNWKSVDKVLFDVVGTIGLVKAAQIGVDMVMGKGNVNLKEQILLNKRKIASDLERKALTETLTTEEMALLQTRNKVTAADYSRMLLSKNITKQQAILMARFAGSNSELKKALVQTGLLTQEEMRNIKNVKLWSLAWDNLKISAKGALVTMVSMLPMLAITSAIGGVIHIIQSYREEARKTEELNKRLVDNTKENIQSIERFLDDYQKSFEKLNNGTLSEDEQVKLWESIREEIEKSVSVSKEFIANLLQIKDITERIRFSEDLLQDTMRIEEVLKRIGEGKGLQLGKGEVLGDSIAKDLSQYVDKVNEIVERYGDTTQTWEKINDIWADPGKYSAYLATVSNNDPWKQLVKATQEAQNEIGATLKSMQDEFEKFKPEILGDDLSTWARNIRLFAASALNNLLSSEDGQKLEGEQLKRLQSSLDEWVAKTIEKELSGARASGLEDEGKTDEYLAKTKTAWQDFYSAVNLMSNRENKKTLLELIKTQAYLQDENRDKFESLWGEAADEMEKHYKQSFMSISNDIKDFEKQKLVIPVLFSIENNETDLQKQFKKDFAEQEYRFIAPTENERDIIAYGARVTKSYKENREEAEKAQKQLEEIPKTDTETYRVLRANAQKRVDDLNKWGNAMKYVIDTWHLLNFEKDKSSGGSKKDILGDAIKDELRIITDMQKSYKEYMKIGVGSTEAMNKAVSEYGSTLEKVNKILAQYGFMTLQPQQIAKMPLQEIRDFYANQLDVAKIKDSVNAIEALEKAIATINVEITKDNYKTIIEGLNSELGKIKDEYELGVELDASPELGQAFADIFNIDTSELPRTFGLVYRRFQREIDKMLKQLNISDDFDILGGDIDAFAKANELDINSTLVANMKKAQKELLGIWKKYKSDSIKDWESMLSKYGDIQTKLIKISKDSAKEQAAIIKRLGTDFEGERAANLLKLISVSEDPKEIERLRAQLLKILQDVVKDKDIALKISTASTNEEKSLISKAYWEDFKNSELYSMTFEEMGRVSTSAIKAILEQLDLLKDKVKEDPASMNALMSAYKKGRDELAKRSPFMDLAQGLRDIVKHTKEAKTAQKEYDDAVYDLDATQDAYNKLKETYKGVAEGTQEAADAADVLSKAEKDVATATDNVKTKQLNLRKALNQVVSTMENIENAANNAAGVFSNFSNILSTLSELMGIAEDSELGVMVNSLIGGFQTMATVLGLVATMAQLVQLSFGWVGAVMIALAGLIALVQYLANIRDMRINQEIEKSENTVKSLELQYKKLQYAIEDAFGVAKSGAQAAAAENKKLQLAEIERQIALEKSRDSKKIDFEKIRELEGQYLELSNEIKNDIKDITNELLGIQSVGDAAEDLVSSMMDAFKSGEDYMQVFEDSFDKMIDNMIMKAIVSRVIGPEIEKMFENVEAVRKKNLAPYQHEVNQLKSVISESEGRSREIENRLKDPIGDLDSAYKAYWEKEYKKQQDNIRRAVERLAEIEQMASVLSPEEVAEQRKLAEETRDNLQQRWDYLMDLYGVTRGVSEEGADLSNLQQGIQSITEDTAGAIEAYLNGISQQVYLENSQLSEIKEYISNFNFDIQLGVLSEILLQLQTSYQTQNAIQSILQGWSNANGMAVRVELQ